MLIDKMQAGGGKKMTKFRVLNKFNSKIAACALISLTFAITKQC